MTLSGDNIRDIILGIIGSAQTIILAVIMKRQHSTKKKIEQVDAKVTGENEQGVAATVDVIHGLVNSQHAELKGELKGQREFTERAMGVRVSKEPSETDPSSGDD